MPSRWPWNRWAVAVAAGHVPWAVAAVAGWWCRFAPVGQRFAPRPPRLRCASGRPAGAALPATGMSFFSLSFILQRVEYFHNPFQLFFAAERDADFAFPLLGTHNGGLDKIEVLDLMHKYLEQCDIPIEIYEYDPLAPDDMFENFMLKWIDISHSEKIKILGSRFSKQIEIIDKAIHEDNIKSMISLIEYQGIGIATMQKCFNLAMSYKKEPTLEL